MQPRATCDEARLPCTVCISSVRSIGFVQRPDTIWWVQVVSGRPQARLHSCDRRPHNNMSSLSAGYTQFCIADCRRAHLKNQKHVWKWHVYRLQLYFKTDCRHNCNKGDVNVAGRGGGWGGVQPPWPQSSETLVGCHQKRQTGRSWWSGRTTADAYRTALSAQDRSWRERRTVWWTTYSCSTVSDSLVYRAGTCAVSSGTTTSPLFWNT